MLQFHVVFGYLQVNKIKVNESGMWAGGIWQWSFSSAQGPLPVAVALEREELNCILSSISPSAYAQDSVYLVV